MLLDTVIIVLRETLEASILISVLMSMSRLQKLSLFWIPLSLLAGLIGAFVYGHYLGEISEWFDYVGQEVVNASMQYLIYLALLSLILLQQMNHESHHGLMIGLMVLTMSLAVTREGSELFVFYTGFLQSGDYLLQALASGFVGLGVGVSAGAIVYYFLQARPLQKAPLIHAVVLTLIAGGMVMQATQLMIQADWIDAGSAVWDSSWLIAETSLTGEVIYAVFGYDATPSVTELMAYLSSLLLIAVGILVIKQKKNRG